MNKIQLIFILDRSGSISGLEEDTIGGYNSFLKKYDNHTNITASTVLFDHEFTLLHNNVPVNKARLNASQYQVRGATALLDAIGYTVQLVKSQSKFDTSKSKCIYIITTDGMENSSTAFDYNAIHKLITREQSNGNEFVFLGANIDAKFEGDKLGIKREFTKDYQSTKDGTKEMFHQMNCMVDQVLSDE